MARIRHISAWLLLASLILTLMAPLPAAAQTASPEQLDLKAVDAFLQQQVKSNRLPGLAVSIIQGDKIVFRQGYGETAGKKPITAQTQFYLGSVTKSFTALAALQLVQQGKLDLDAPVQKYLPWFSVADPNASSKITVRNLLNHTSGLSETGDPNAGAYTDSLEAQARLLSRVRLTAPIGTKFQYYNQNYRLVGLLLEQVSGQSYSEYLKEHIFTPLGMSRTTADPAEAPDLAQGYTRFFGFPLEQPQPFVPGSLPSGYIISTAEDMGRFLIAQLNNRQPDGQPLLQPDLLALMRTPPAGIGSEYGMGWLVMENGNTLAHGGALEHYQTFMVIGLKEKVGFMLLINQNSLENTLLETNAVRDGLLAILNGKDAQKAAYGWVGWVLLALCALDLFNHVRLFAGLRRPAQAPTFWQWGRAFLGLFVPLGVIFGLPWLVHSLQGGDTSWATPFRLAPDLIGWLLLGMSLTLLRSLIRLYLLANEYFRRRLRFG